MKARLGGDRQFLLTLVPENDEDRAALRAFAASLGRVHIINCRGLKYLDPEVEFLIQSMPSGGD